MDRILLMLSGGIDSTGALYKLFTEKEYKNYRVHIHHLYLNNGENKYDAEKVAVKNILHEFGRLGYTEYEYTESTHVFPSGAYAWDSDVAYFMARILCNSYKDIKKFALGVTADDRAASPANTDVWTSVKEFDILLRKSVERIYPVDMYTKKQIIDFLPESLLRVTWSCRNATLDSFNNWIPCGVCKSCIALQAAKK